MNVKTSRGSARKHFLMLGLLLFCALPLAVQAQWFSEQRDIMGTRIDVNLWHDDSSQGRAAVAAVMAEVERLDLLLSPYKSSSELSRFNQQAGRGLVSISREFAHLLEKSLYYSRLSEGAFDITFASLGQHYNYRTGQKPTQAQTQSQLAAINYRHVFVDRQALQASMASAAMKIDLGGIAKGYAVDQGVAIMRRFGVEHGSISAGGDSRVLGDKRGKPWVIGIKNPRKADAVAVRLPLDNLAISTSGDYERYFIDVDSGERIHHILNPRTGASASGVVSVSVLGALGLDTDPLSTTVFVLGVEQGLALINRLHGIDAIIIDRSGQVFYSDGLQQPSA